MSGGFSPALVGLFALGGIAAAETEGVARRGAAASFDFSVPSSAFPYHHVAMTLDKQALKAGTIWLVDVDGKRCRDARFFNVGLHAIRGIDPNSAMAGEAYDGRVHGSHDFKVIVPCNWSNGSKHSVGVEIAFESGGKTRFVREGTAPAKGGYWNADWPRSISITLGETAGLNRYGEPVHLSLGLFSDLVKDPAAEIRVVTYDPKHPKAGDDGYVLAPCQVTAVSHWRDEEVLAIKEKDAKTGEPIHRYDPTTTVDLVFLADVPANQEKVYQVLYGNPNAKAIRPQTDLKVQQQKGLGQIVQTAHYRIGLATNSGAIETVTVLGSGEPILLEHKLETNGAVHWNPGCYAPPTPWVHASDWEKPEFRQLTGPLMHRTRRYAPLPHMDSVSANVSYTFYAGQPYVISSSIMQVLREIFVKAMRNGEIVFNHAVLNEFVWRDPRGRVRSLDIATARKHPIHALEIPADVAWMAFVSREKKVGFASILLDYRNTNVYGDPASEAQPYIYVQNGPWIYWSRAMVYPFGSPNLTRLMRVRKGSLYIEKSAYLPFRLADGDEPFKDVERACRQLTHPLLVHEWAATDDRTPEKWVMPLLTMPFDEGVSGAVGSQKKSE